MKILVIIPAYNEADSILQTVNSLHVSGSDKWEYLVVNDGSNDDTERILRENHITHVTLVTNLGIGGAVQTGYIYAQSHNFDIAVQFDGDGQHDSAFLPRIIEPIKAHQADLVIGSRYLSAERGNFQSTALRRIGSWVLSQLILLRHRVRVSDPTSGFRAANRRAIEAFVQYYPVDYPEPESIGLLHCQQLTVAEEPVEMNARTNGKSSITPIKSVLYMLKVALAILIR